MDLRERVALITGGASGVGAATASRLAELGATIVVADIDADGAAQIAASLPTPNPHVGILMDVTDGDAWHHVIERIDHRYGRLDIAHLNAGVMSRRPAEPVADLDGALTEAAYRRVMAVNVDGVVLGLLATLPLIGRTGGDIVVTASRAGLGPLDFDPFYAASKHALVGLVRSLVHLGDRGVRVNAICPQGVDTAIVPDDLRGSVPLAPASYIADVAVAVLESSRGGQVWFAPGVGEAPFPVGVPELRPEP